MKPKKTNHPSAGQPIYDTLRLHTAPPPANTQPPDGQQTYAQQANGQPPYGQPPYAEPPAYPPGSYPHGSYPPPANPPPQPQQPYPQQPQQPYYPPGSYPPGTYPPQQQQPYYPPGAYPPGSYPPGSYPPAPAPQGRRKRRGSCAGTALLLLLGLLALLAIYLFAPIRTNLLVLGIDRSPEGTATGRSDTMILVSVMPFKPTVGMLSIPRDLWVRVPGAGENRINTAHFFAEAKVPGSGPAAAVQAVEENFDVRIPYYLRVRFDAFQQIVEAMGGVTVNLPEDMAGLPAGQHTLNGDRALAFVRDRQGADDFYRMEHAQLMFKAMARQLISPAAWPRLPAVFGAAMQSMDTNLPVWQAPRLGLALLRAVLTDGIDNRTIRREMVEPYVTDQGAQVLLPRWEQINPVIDEMFGGPLGFPKPGQP